MHTAEMQCREADLCTRVRAQAGSDSKGSHREIPWHLPFPPNQVVQDTSRNIPTGGEEGGEGRGPQAGFHHKEPHSGCTAGAQQPLLPRNCAVPLCPLPAPHPHPSGAAPLRRLRVGSRLSSRLLSHPDRRPPQLPAQGDPLNPPAPFPPSPSLILHSTITISR